MRDNNELILKKYEHLIEIRDSEEIKRILLNILLFIKDVCEKNDIKYYLAYGSLIGAVRHHGFIPWDDDIDIMMPRPDFIRFQSLLSDPANRYILLSPFQNDYYYNYGKVVDTSTVLLENGYKPIDNLGIYVDVFPLDGMPDNQNEREKANRKLVKKRKIISAFGKPFPQIRKNLINYFSDIFYYIACHCSDLQKRQQEYLNIVNKFSYSDSKYVYAAGGADNIKSGIKNILPAKWFENTIDVLFEESVFSAPSGYDDLLHQTYGNYMKLPPKEMQISRHDFIAYYKTAELADQSHQDR